MKTEKYLWVLKNKFLKSVNNAPTISHNGLHICSSNYIKYNILIAIVCVLSTDLIHIASNTIVSHRKLTTHIHMYTCMCLYIWYEKYGNYNMCLKYLLKVLNEQKILWILSIFHHTHIHTCNELWIFTSNMYTVITEIAPIPYSPVSYQFVFLIACRF